MLDASLDFEPLLRETFSTVQIWKRLVYNLEQAPVISRSGGFFLRRLSAADRPSLENLSPPNRWIWNTWQDAAALAASGFAWGAFRGDRLASLACSFFVGDDYEDIGVVTENEFRAQGLSTACTAQLCLDIQARSRTPCWTTSTTNRASQRVAEKTGFTIAREDFLFVINTEIPD
jgi:predicted GNAT family acetyltransferase